MGSEPVTTVDAGDVRIACITSRSIDDTSRPLAVCVHGFPDTAATWRFLTPRLEEAGWRVASPYLRGYAPSTVPADGCYQTAASVLDVIAVHDHFDGDERAALIGHDWGAPIVYGAATHAPHRWSNVVGMAVPPGPALGSAFLTNPEQLKRSWYMFFFQHPLADAVVPADNLAFIEMIWHDWAPGYDAWDDLPAVKESIGDPVNLAAALGYYRAALGGVGVRADLEPIQHETQALPPQPTLYLHGTEDGCIGVEVARAAEEGSGDGIRFEYIEGAAHFLHLERPDTINAHILEFLT